MNKYSKLLFIIIPVLIVLVFTQSKMNASAEGNDAPDFSITDLKGETISLSGLKGKVIIINFWATWCPPCREEIPGFLEVYDKYKDQGLVILGIALDNGGPDVVNPFVKNMAITYPVAMATQEIYQSYQPGQYIPATFIIDRTGKIKDKHVGFLDKASLEKTFLELSK